MTETRPRLPPGQQLVAPGKWPIVGERSGAGQREPWTISVAGCVATPVTFRIEELAALGVVHRAVDLHCVTRWTRFDVPFRGVELATLLEVCPPTNSAKFVSFVSHSPRGHSTSLPFDEALAEGTLVVWEAEGQPIPPEHGGPVRVIVPNRYLYKSLKWLHTIELLQEDRLGYWEQSAGYHNHADPWAEERYMAPTLSRAQMRQVLASRDWQGMELRSLDASDHDLLGLQAQGALLRDARFNRAVLRQARFDGANLTNAHFTAADAMDASFAGADVEGANYEGADLRGADFRGASIFGATFCPPDGEISAARLARLDRFTRFDEFGLAQLAPRQQEFVAAALQSPPS